MENNGNNSSFPNEIESFFKRPSGRSLMIKGSPGTGKTTFALQLLEELADPDKSFYLSTWLSDEALYSQFPWLEQKEMRSRIGKSNLKHGYAIHGISYTGIYLSWIGMRHRCYNKNHADYKYYGGRGIFVCRRWRDSFENFLKDMGERPKNKSIDRINNNGSYGPWNCKWATAEEQRNNQRR